ncbi:PepSY domain-containing protein [Georgenia sp. 311]|uniref:PepSY domain-containing protein n=1 Tax=Georgenia sp. 311 TaxID=2585134 RepID=UPI001111F0A9|nr:PepSY domain-containing protein [Georgenia sp. 311]TNC17981.1 PepSY domain-containing protein [Georgenia sp. 311]
MRHPGRVAATVGLTAGLVVGCTSSEEPAEPSVSASEVVTDREPDNPEMTPGDDASPDPISGEDGAVRALSTAAEELDGQAFEIDRTDDAGEELWEVSVAVGDEKVEAYVSADGNALVREGEREPLDAEDRRRLQEATVTASEAATTAVRETGASVEDLDLSEERGALVWEIELRTTDGATTEARVDAVSGELL